MPGQNLLFYGTTGLAGTLEGQSQPDPALWLGDWRASQTLHSLQSTLTASQTAASRHYVTDASQIGAGVQAHRMKWLVMVTGPAALSAARVAAFDTATGVMKLDRPLPTAAASGNVYRLFSRGNVWPDVTAAQAATGESRYRCICFRNEHGASLSDLRIYFRDLSAGGPDFHRFHQSAANQPFLARSSDQVDLFDSLGQHDPAGGTDNFGNAGGWQNPFGYTVADTNVATLANNSSIAIWLRRVIPPASQFRRSVAVQLIVESSTTGSDPSPLAASALMAYDVAADAAPLVGDIAPDRFVHVEGGARLRGRVSRAGAPVAARAVRWALRSGDPGGIHTDDEPLAGLATTDAAGDVFATYRAPGAEFEGAVAKARLLIGAGEEVGDPQPRLSLAQTIDDGDAVSGDVTLPSATQSWDEDLAAGFWPAIA